MISMLLSLILLQARPNIVTVVVDDAGFAEFPSGPFPTPNLNVLASEGIRYTAHYTYPTCSPTRVALLTGRYPARIGVNAPIAPGSSVGMAGAEVTLAEILHDAGYQTLFVGKWHVGHALTEMWPLHQGFERALWNPWGLSYPAFEVWDGDTRIEVAPSGGAFVAYNAQLTTRIKDQALAYISERDARPFFLEVCFTQVHQPNAAIAKYAGETWHTAALREVDAAIGAVKTALPTNTILLVLSDNGAPNEANNVPFRGKKASQYEGAIRTPAILWGLGQGVVSEPVAAWDWMPTLAALAGATMPTDRHIDGSAIATAELWWPLAFRSGRWVITKASGAWTLYDIVADPGQAAPVNDPVLTAQLVARWKAITPKKGL